MALDLGDIKDQKTARGATRARRAPGRCLRSWQGYQSSKYSAPGPSNLQRGGTLNVARLAGERLPFHPPSRPLEFMVSRQFALTRIAESAHKSRLIARQKGRGGSPGLDLVSRTMLEPSRDGKQN